MREAGSCQEFSGQASVTRVCVCIYVFLYKCVFVFVCVHPKPKLASGCRESWNGRICLICVDALKAFGAFKKKMGGKQRGGVTCQSGVPLVLTIVGLY